MPRQIVTTDGETFAHAEYELQPLGPSDVRLRVRFAAPKHGTERHALSGSALDRKQWDAARRIFIERPEGEASGAPGGPRTVGNMVVGDVVELGPEVEGWAVGDQAFAYGPIREIHQSPASGLYRLEKLAPVDAVCIDPAHVAFVALRDGNVRIGDDVAVFGLGAIGLMAIQIARASGARRVIGIDPMPARRGCAMEHGADHTVDPAACDAGLAIKDATDGHGVDVAVETSGNSRALHEAIRCVRQCGTVVHVPWGPRDCSHLHLDEEFHLNRVTILGSQAWVGWGNADRSHPLWTAERAYQATIDLFHRGLLTGHGVVSPIVPFSDAPAALSACLADPSKAIKLGVTFP